MPCARQVAGAQCHKMSELLTSISTPTGSYSEDCKHHKYGGWIIGDLPLLQFLSLYSDCYCVAARAKSLTTASVDA